MSRSSALSNEALWPRVLTGNNSITSIESSYPLAHPVLLPPQGLELTKKEKETRNAARMGAFNELRLIYGTHPRVMNTLEAYRLPPYRRESLDPTNPLYALETSAAQYRMLKKPEVYPLFQAMESGLETYAQLAGTLEESNEQEQNALMGAVAASAVLLHTNLRLPLHITRKNFGPKYSEHPMYEDVAMASIGAMDRSVQLFDYRHGWMLSTFAVRVINNQVDRFITNNLRSVRIPVNIDEDHRRMMKASTDLMIALQRKPTVAEIAVAVNRSELEVLDLQQLGSLYAVSLDEKIAKTDDNGDFTLGDLQVDTRPANSPAAAFEETDHHNIILAAMTEAELTAAERITLSLRHHIFDETLVETRGIQPSYNQLFQQAAGHAEGLPLNQIGKALGNISRVKVRALEERALAKLAMTSLESSLA